MLQENQHFLKHRNTWCSNIDTLEDETDFKHEKKRDPCLRFFQIFLKARKVEETYDSIVSERNGRNEMIW